MRWPGEGDEFFKGGSGASVSGGGPGNVAGNCCTGDDVSDSSRDVGKSNLEHGEYEINVTLAISEKTLEAIGKGVLVKGQSDEVIG